MEQISLTDRAHRLAEPQRRGGAAVASVHHRGLGDCLVVIRGAGGEAHLPWAEFGADDDSAQDVALNALCSSSGTGSLRWTIKPGVRVGEWTTDTGVHLEGFAVRVSDLFAQMAGLEVAFLPWREVAAAELSPQFHTVAPEDHSFGDDQVEVESPTLTVTDPTTGRRLLLRGLTGHLVAQWRHRVMPGG